MSNVLLGAGASGTLIESCAPPPTQLKPKAQTPKSPDSHDLGTDPDDGDGAADEAKSSLPAGVFALLHNLSFEVDGCNWCSACQGLASE